MTTADDRQASLIQQHPLLFSLPWTAPPSNANFHGDIEVSRRPLSWQGNFGKSTLLLLDNLPLIIRKLSVKTKNLLHIIGKRYRVHSQLNFKLAEHYPKINKKKK